MFCFLNKPAQQRPDSARPIFYDSVSDPRREGPSILPVKSCCFLPRLRLVGCYSVSLRSAAMSSAGGDKKPSGSRPTIRTLADLNRSSGHGSDSDSDAPQEYYTGGEKRLISFSLAMFDSSNLFLFLDREDRAGDSKAGFFPL